MAKYIINGGGIGAGRSLARNMAKDLAKLQMIEVVEQGFRKIEEPVSLLEHAVMNMLSDGVPALSIAGHLYSQGKDNPRVFENALGAKLWADIVALNENF